MRKALFFSFAILSFYSYGQKNIKTKEIKLSYSNGYELFHICPPNTKVIFDDKKEYYWYTEYSNIKSTKGSAGGSLLHGNYKLYDKTGNLRKENNYYLGLLHGEEKTWDSLGNITAKTIYNKGEPTYSKRQDDEKYWIEFNGEVFKVGTVKKVYTPYNLLITEEIQLPNFYKHIKKHFAPSGNLMEELTKEELTGYLVGKYTAYYENGKLKIDAEFFNGKNTNVRIGTWIYYNSTGETDSIKQYKSGVEYWPNKELKVAGGFIFDKANNSWVKTGEWRWYSKEGKFDSSKKFNMGIEAIE